ncbi:hypothetical protein ACQ859_09125 [Roseateles chitinivorans]|uniref:hypothetical protein n=1 Tax=Roseateles chitinivorans TaxID=2917965 RepID=UPI003D67C0BD
MTTSPKLPADEVPLTDAAIDRILSIAGDGLILVGGQALNFWMKRFGISSKGAVVTNDADFIGNIQQAAELAHGLNARLMKTPSTARSALVAQIRMSGAAGKFGNIDVLHQLYTVSTPKKTVEFTRRVIANAMPVQLHEGFTIRVMEPFDLLESRLQNAVGFSDIDRKGPHVLTQARWAIDVAKAALLLHAFGKGEFQARVGVKVQQILRLARSAPGRRAWRELDIDVLDAIDADLLQAIVPACAPQLDGVRVMQDQRMKLRG